MPIQSAHHESRHLERERDPRAARAIRGVGGVGTARRHLPAGDQGEARSDPANAVRSKDIRATGTAPAATPAWALHVRRELRRERRRTPIPTFDLETRIVQAQIEDTVFTSVYVPNGGKDFEAKIAFIHALIGYAAGSESARPEARALRRHEHRPHRHATSIRRSASRARSASSRRSASCSSGSSTEGGLVDVGRMLYPDDENYFTLVGAVAQHARAQHRLAPRLRPGQRAAGEEGGVVSVAARESARAITRRWWRRSRRRSWQSTLSRRDGSAVSRHRDCHSRVATDDPVQTKRPAYAGLLLLRGARDYSRTTSTTRRLAERPSRVLFDSSGSVSPYEIVDMRASGSLCSRER